MIDLRSDTVTLPPDRMREAMAAAELGDDVMREDPTVNRLEEEAAGLTGKEAALLVSSGTMGNLLGILTLAARASEVVADADSHVFMYEAAGAATLAGVQVRTVNTTAGVMAAGQIEAAIRPAGADEHQPRTSALFIENTHNRHGGVAWPAEDLAAAIAVARRHRLRVHIDGARLFNAALASGLGVQQICAGADTVTFCLSKGLACPAGSLFCGPTAVVEEARRWRKMLGGGMRQAGVLAAAGLYALEHLVDRLREDHANALVLAEGLAEMPGVEIDLRRVQTNLVLFRIPGRGTDAFLEECRSRGLLGGEMGGGWLRFVTHLGVTPDDVGRALGIVAGVLRGA